MNAARILIPAGLAMLLLFGGSGCISNPGAVCNIPKITSVPNSAVEIQNPCLPAWTAHDEFTVLADGISVKKIVDAFGGVTRLLVIGPNWQPQPGNPEIPVEFEYVTENGTATGGVLYLTIVGVLQVTATATPSTIVSGQSTQLNAAAAGGSPPYSYLWSPGAPLITEVNIPNPTAAPKQNTDIKVTVTDFVGRTATATVTVMVTGGSTAPILSGITPAFGYTTGSTFVTISGDNFVSGGNLLFGSAQPQTGTLVVRDSRTITALTPPGSGKVDVTVTNPDGQSATLPQAFTYVTPLTIGSIIATPQVVARGTASQLQVNAAGGLPFASGPPYLFQWTTDTALSNLTIPNPVATPTVTSAYHVTVTDSVSNTSSGSVAVTISGAALRACLDTIPPDQNVRHGVPVTFDAGCSSGPNPIVLFEWWASWNPANPTPPDFSGPALVRQAFTYPSAGRATARLRVTDSTGATSAATDGFFIQ